MDLSLCVCVFAEENLHVETQMQIQITNTMQILLQRQKYQRAWESLEISTEHLSFVFVCVFAQESLHVETQMQIYTNQKYNANTFTKTEVAKWAWELCEFGTGHTKATN